jgi:fucose permease
LSAVVALEEKPLLLVIALVAFFYVACEMAFWNWIPKLLLTKGIPEKTALNILSLGFASGILVGRLAGSWILRRFSIVTIGLSASVLMALTTYWTIWSAGAGMAWISVFCAGLVMAPVYPGTVGATGDSFPRMTATCIGIVGTSGWIGTATISWLIGAIAGSDDSRLRWALLVIPGFSVVLVGVILVLRPMLAAAKARRELATVQAEPAA